MKIKETTILEVTDSKGSNLIKCTLSDDKKEVTDFTVYPKKFTKSELADLGDAVRKIRNKMFTAKEVADQEECAVAMPKYTPKADIIEEEADCEVAA
jgi:hypothetical protein